MPIYDSINENVEKYWNMLNQENIISLLVKTIEISTGDVEIKSKTDTPANYSGGFKNE